MKLLGKGSYGQVYQRNNRAVKRFQKLSHFIQEYIAMYFLRHCKYFVTFISANIDQLEIEMKLYDGTVRDWLFGVGEKTMRDKIKLIHDILSGLIEIHSRNLAHADLKLNNILMLKKPLKAAIGDLGFISVDKYTKTDRTTRTYKEMNVSKSIHHDIYSFGICMFEIISETKLYSQYGYDEIKTKINKGITNDTFRSIIQGCVEKDKSHRITAEKIYEIMFVSKIPSCAEYQIHLVDNKFSFEELNKIKLKLKRICTKYHINRSKLGYYAVVNYFNQKGIRSQELIDKHLQILCMILSSVFGDGQYNEKVITLPNSEIKNILKHLCEDWNFVYILFDKNTQLIKNIFTSKNY